MLKNNLSVVHLRRVILQLVVTNKGQRKDKPSREVRFVNVEYSKRTISQIQVLAKPDWNINDCRDVLYQLNYQAKRQFGPFCDLMMTSRRWILEKNI